MPAALPMEVSAPDISAYRQGNTGIPYAASFDSKAAGPHVLLCAIVHGNEISGAIVLDALLRAELRPRRGRLSLIFANPAAYATFDPTRPLASRYIDEDMNRLWSPALKQDGRNSVERVRARALLPLIEAADLLLDLHSMQSPAPPLLLAGDTEKGRRLALALRAPAVTVADAGHSGGTRLRDYGGFAVPGDARNALLAECGQHWRQDTVAAAFDITYRFLSHHGIVTPDDAAPHLLPQPAPPARWIQVTGTVTATSPQCRFVRQFASLEVVRHAGTLIAVDGSREIRTPYDNCVLVMPTRRPLPGYTAVRLGRYMTADCDHAA